MSRLTITLWRCGRCGKPRGLHHVCGGGRKGRDRIKLGLTVTCPTCGKPAPNPLTHTCSVRSDWKKRQAAQKRAEQAERRKRKRRAAAARKRARLKERKRLAAERRKELRAKAAAGRRTAGRSQSHDKNRHEHTECADQYCDKYACRIYREGQESVRAAERAEGYAEGYGDGLTAAYQVI